VSETGNDRREAREGRGRGERGHVRVCVCVCLTVCKGGRKCEAEKGRKTVAGRVQHLCYLLHCLDVVECGCFFFQKLENTLEALNKEKKEKEQQPRMVQEIEQKIAQAEQNLGASRAKHATTMISFKQAYYKTQRRSPPVNSFKKMPGIPS